MPDDSALDYRLAWRWLVPARADDRVGQYGFSAEEERFLRNALPRIAWQEEAASIDVWIVNALSDAPDISRTEQAQRVCVLADRKQGKVWRNALRAKFANVREYALLPAGSPRVVVPLSSTQNAVCALSLHRPGRRMAQVGVNVARWLARVGYYALLQERVLLVASRLSMPAPYGAIQAGLGGQKDYALYLGTPDDNRKTVVLPLERGVPDVIVKMGASPKARAALANEADALRVLSGSPLARSVPKLFDVISAEGHIALHQEYRPRMWVSRQALENEVVAFLGRLSALDSKWKHLAEVLASMSCQAGEGLPQVVGQAYQELYGRLKQYAEAGLMICFHRSHGDLAPWNCLWSEQGLFVYDWEASEPQGMALGDAFAYATAPALLLQRKPSPDRTLLAALRMANKVARAAGRELDSRVYLALWLFGQLAKTGFSGQMIVALARTWR